MLGGKHLVEIGLIAAVAVAIAGTGGADPVWLAAAELWVVAVGLGMLARLSGPTLMTLPWLPLVVVALVLAQLLAGVSVASYATQDHFLLLVTCLVAFYAAALLAARERARARLVAGLVVVGALTAIYGIARYLSIGSPAYDAVGPYVNRNHFAGLLEMALPLSLALAVARSRGEAADEGSWRWWLTRPEAQKLFLKLAAAVVLLSGILLSRSRMGLFSAVCALLLMGFLWARKEARARRWAVAALIIVLGAAGAFSLWVAADPILTRLDGQAFADTGRPLIWAGTVRLIAGNPWLGTGWGTFARAYPAVQSPQLNGFVLHAHNDYLEHVAELGLPGAVLLWTGIGVVYTRALRALVRAGPRKEESWLWGCAGALTAILLHSFTDFNLYIPANALVFSLLLGLAYGLTRETTDKPGESARMA